MKVNEVFEGIQGEGRYAGYPSIFIRLSGCNKKCTFCDTKHEKHTNLTPLQIGNRIIDSKAHIAIFTGGEPTLQIKEVKETINYVKQAMHNQAPAFHLETNGYRIPDTHYFDYISFSPKDEQTAQKVFNKMKDNNKMKFDIKITTDLTTNRNLIMYATMLMPLTEFKEPTDTKTKQAVWEYCLKNNLKYTPRIHVDVWGKTKGR